MRRTIPDELNGHHQHDDGNNADGPTRSESGWRRRIEEQVSVQPATGRPHSPHRNGFLDEYHSTPNFCAAVIIDPVAGTVRMSSRRRARPMVRKIYEIRSAWPARCPAMAILAVAPGDGAFRTCMILGSDPIRKSSTKDPSGSIACARTPEGPLNRSWLSSSGTNRRTALVECKSFSSPATSPRGPSANDAEPTCESRDRRAPIGGR